MELTRANRLRVDVWLVVGAVAFWGSAVANGPMFAQDATPRIRVIPYGLDAPIAPRLLPGDSIVVVQEEFNTADYSGIPSASQALDDLVMFTDTAAVIEAKLVTGELVERGTMHRCVLGSDPRRFGPAPTAFRGRSIHRD